MNDKIQCLVNLLFDAEMYNRELQNQVQVRDKMIKDLQEELHFCDLEIQDMKKVLETSADVEHIMKLQTKISALNKVVEILSYEICL
jgi:hypothetical protein